MSKQARRLKEYVTNVLNHNNTRMEQIFQDSEHFIQKWKLFKTEEMNFTLNTLAPSLQTIASYLFTPGEAYKPYYVTALFMYCIKLDEYFKKNQKDYKTDLLVDALVNILINIGYNVPKSYCSIL